MTLNKLNFHLLTVLGLSHDSAEIVMDRISELERERDELARWKKEALLVESRWDCQKVGKLLEIGLGEDIRPNIEPRIRALLDARRQVETKLSDALVENAHLKDRFAAGDCKDSAADVQILRAELLRLREICGPYDIKMIDEALAATT